MSAMPLVLALVLQVSAPAGRLQVRVSSAADLRAVVAALVELPELSRTAATNEDGEVQLAGIPPGLHHVRVRRLGFAPHTLHVFVGDGRPVELHVVLSPVSQPLRERRVVMPPPVDLPGNDGSVPPLTRRLSLQQLRQHPLLAEPDLLDGVAGGHATVRSEARDGLHLMGGESDHVAWRIDGIPVRSPYYAGALGGALLPEATSSIALVTTLAQQPTDDALGGVVQISTPTAPLGRRWSGGTSTTNSRLLFEWGRGPDGGGLLLGGRLVAPGLAWRKGEATHLAGAAADGIARWVTPLAGGTLRALAITAGSEASFASQVPDLSGGDPGPRHEFEWQSSAGGVTWDGAHGGTRLGLAVWGNATRTDVRWNAAEGPALLDTRLDEVAVEAVAHRPTARGSWSLGLQGRRQAGRYGVIDGGLPWQRDGARWLVSLQPSWARSSPRSTLALGAALWGAPSARFAPFLDWSWRPTSTWSLAASASRRLQFTPSYRNPESIASFVFAADLPAIAAPNAPIARSDQLLVGAAWHPTLSRTVTLRGWVRRLHDLALPAIGNDRPFAVREVATGDGRAAGASIDATLTRARWGVLASYGAHYVRRTARDTTWQPEFGVRHVATAGATAFLTTRVALRLGGSAGWGRRATGFIGPFEWESCNLRDRGCEFAGAPTRALQGLGAIEVPFWMRWDLSARAHGHLRLGGHELQFEGYATWSNVLDRLNVLTRLSDPVTRTPQTIVMRPSAPLVIGLDWRM